MTSRDAWLDNAKMALVTLVVVGHAWTLLPDLAVNEWLYDFLYAWHVPAFVLVTGYLSRNFTWTRSRLLSLVTTVAVPYVVFESLMSLYRMRVGGEHLEDVFADPHWPLWYLAALFLWRLATPALRSTPWMIPVSVAVSLAGGVFAGELLDLSRVLGFLPFFALGVHATPERLAVLARPRLRPVAVGVLVGVAGLAAFTDRLASTEWLYYRSRYADLGAGALEGAATRGVLLVIGLAAALSFLALVPRRAGWFSQMGTWTLVVYLFHGFAVKTAAYAGFDDWSDAHPLVSLPLTTALATGLALLLAAGPVARRLTTVVDPYGAILRATEPRRRPVPTPGQAAAPTPESAREREPVGASR
ncbi:acyltransferase family protein [Nocardioides taihuensis]|uniref:Acyltransferase family protein n=1 Tax=Nocardioides taihuensis TaxID=1835606 RepID=A0ABW0BMR7_9ACTN